MDTTASFIGLVTVVIVVTWVFFHQRRRRDLVVLRTMQDQIAAITIRQAMPINAAFQALLTKELTHAHTPELDALLARAGPPSNLSPGEWERMRQLLDERYQDTADEQIDDNERDAAFIYPIIVKRASQEYERIKRSHVAADRDNA